MEYKMIWQSKIRAYTYREPWILTKKFRTVVFEVLFFVGNSVCST